MSVRKDEIHVATLRELAEAHVEIARLTKALDEREADMHMRIRAGYDKTVADAWRAEVEKRDAEIARLTADLAAARAEVDCGQDGPCAMAPGCARHWQERNRELADELAAARAVPADVEAAIDAIECRGCGHGDPVTNADADRLKAAIARAISDATAAGGTVGGLLAAAPVVEYQVDLGRGPRWRQTRHGRTRTWLGSSPVGMSWTEWSVGSDDVDEYAARLVPADHADADPATRGPLPKGG